MDKLRGWGAKVEYCDPYFPEFPEMRNYQFDLKSKPLTRSMLQKYDCVVIGTDHDVFDYDLIFANASLVVDTRGRAKHQSESVFRA